MKQAATEHESDGRNVRPGPPRSGHHQTAGLLIAGLLVSAPAHAYIDPGTGSVILQGLLAGIAVAIGVVRAYWQRIRAFFAGSRTAAEIDPAAGQDADREDAKAQSEI